MPSSLRWTRILIALALLAIAPVFYLAAADVVRDVFPRCHGTLEETLEPARTPNDPGVSVFHDQPQPGGFSIHMDTTSKNGVFNMRLSRVENDEQGPCSCGAVTVAVAGSTWSNVDVRRVAEGHYIVVNSTHRGGDVVVATFRASDTSQRRFQPSRIVLRRHLPAAVVVLALGALVIAALRARRGITYATRIHAWTEARLDGGGRIESDTGEMLGVLDSTGRRLFPGTVLVAPEATETKGIYRDLPILPRRLVAMGTHARWRDATMRGFRDARALCAISTACSALALAARFLGG